VAWQKRQTMIGGYVDIERFGELRAAIKATADPSTPVGMTTAFAAVGM
jgi:hypothetical protein